MLNIYTHTYTINCMYESSEKKDWKGLRVIVTMSEGGAFGDGLGSVFFHLVFYVPCHTGIFLKQKY